MMKLVKRDEYILKYANDELRNSREIVEIRLANDGHTMKYASDRLNREFVLKAVKLCGFALEHVSDELKDDREIVMEAVRN